MILQTFQIPKSSGPEEELYYRRKGTVQPAETGILLEEGCILDTDTYMNILDVAAWKKYTAVSELYLDIVLSGTGKLLIFLEEENNDRMVLSELDFSEEKKRTCSFRINKEIKTGFIFFSLKALKATYLYKACYRSEEDMTNEVYLSLIICTYKRQQQLEKNMQVLMQSRFFTKNSRQYGHLFLRIVDNASEIKCGSRNFVRIYHNENTGGSGGFSRGIQETENELEEYPATHLLLSDDDVEISEESLYRLYALLSLMKPEYHRETISGRMFRMDHKEIQYTALEIWNRGDIRHIGWNQNMTVKENLWTMNQNQRGEYSGWWFACFPLISVKGQLPLPFFLHCDDVEYGLRQGGEPIILNGIQVWHETYENRQNPILAYYDMRNSQIVNAMYDYLPEKEQMLKDWFHKISCAHQKEDYETEYMLIKGMRDYCRGYEWFMKADVSKIHKILQRKRFLIKWKNKILWRYVYVLLNRENDNVRQTYREKNCKGSK